MTASISLEVMGLFSWSIWFWFCFSPWYMSRKIIYFYLYFPILLNILFCSSIWFFSMSSLSVVSVSVVMYCCFFCFCFCCYVLSWFFSIWIQSLCLLVRLGKWLSILSIFSKNQLLVLMIFCLVLFASTWLISVLSVMISYHLLFIYEYSSFSSRAFRRAVELLVLDLSNFFMNALRTIRFPLSKHCFHCVP